jgi:hypothetical protein
LLIAVFSVGELAHQLLRVVRTVDTAFAEAGELLDGLLIKILAMDGEERHERTPGSLGPALG